MSNAVKKRFYVIVVLGLLSAIGPFSIDMYLPAFPAIASSLHSTISRVSLSLSSFFIGISIGQLLYGPLLDRFGRKRPLYAGLFLYLVASIGCALARSVDALILMRLLQALGGCVGMVASRAMVRDIFHVRENAKIFSLLMLVVAVSPIIAPTLGGYVSAALSWQYIFLILIFINLLILGAIFFILPESRPANPDFSLRPRPILISFLKVLKEPQFYTYALTGSMASAGLYAYIAGSPYVFMVLYKVTTRTYGWIFAAIAMGLIGASQLNRLLLRRLKSEQIVQIALLCQSLTGLLLFIGAVSGVLGLYGAIFLITIFLCCQGFTFPNTSALSLAPFDTMAGSASAILGAMQMGIGSLTTAMVSYLNNHTALPMTGVMAGCALSSFLILNLGKTRIRYRTDAREIEEQTAEMISTS